jgi:hypothetical protein
MDNYPEHLTPPKNENGVILYDKFPEWSAWAEEHFPTVSENVAQYWLHENWGVSPYYYIKSRDYRFEAVEWPSARLFDLRSEWDDFDPELKGCIRGGRRICHNDEFGEIHRLARYVLEHSC